MLRARPVLGILLAMLVAVACGGGSTPAATTSGGGSAATPVPTADAGGGTGGGEGTGGGINLGGAISALEDLDNFAFRMEMKATGSTEFMMVPKEGSFVMEGRIILKPADKQAADITMTTIENGASPSSMGIRLVDGMSYVNLGGDQWVGSPVDDMESQLSSYQPESLLSGFSSISGLSVVGDEEKNGLATTHYRGEDSTGLVSMFGLPDGVVTTDVWIAKDGGFVVSQAVTAQASAGGEDGTFTMSIDLTAANDPSLVVEAPDNLMEIPSFEP